VYASQKTEPFGWNDAMKLHAYLLTLSDAEREEFASNCRAKLNYLWKIARGFPRGMRPGAGLAARIETASNQKVRRWESIPETWHETWPELVGTAGAPDIEAIPPHAKEEVLPC
jgi:hypothetical protein